jgi:3-phytase
MQRFWLSAFWVVFAFQVNAQDIAQVVAKVETPPSPTKRDVLDNPVVYVDRSDPAASFVLCTNKDKMNGGVHVYDLKGREIRFMQEGRLNSIDIRYDVSFKGGDRVDLVAATHRGRNSIVVYKVDAPDKSLTLVGEIPLKILPYGGCFYRNASTGGIYFFVTSKAGDLQQWQLIERNGKISGRLVRALNIGSKSEGCVADDQEGALFVAEEAVGIWRYNADPIGGESRVQVDQVGPYLQADVEGLALYQGEEGQKYLLASSQGNDSYCVYSGQSPYPYIGSFKVVDTDDMEGTEKTDGITVVSVPLGFFPEGLFIAHDNRSRKGGGSNFKFVDWRDIQKSLELKIAMR